MLRWLAEVLSPPRCAACSLALPHLGRVFCSACAATVERIAPAAFGARQSVGPAAFGARLLVCSPTDECIAFASYGGALATAIRHFKYEDAAYLARPLGALLRMACRAAKFRADLVVPVPLHRHRLIERGYNQSALLAREVAAELGVRLAARALARITDTAVQAELARGARHANVRGAFRVRSPRAVEGRAIALVDDVMTTGATLSACATPLLEAGARSVKRVVLARTLTDLSADSRKASGATKFAVLQAEPEP
jgi:ComF family protein